MQCWVTTAPTASRWACCPAPRCVCSNFCYVEGIENDKDLEKVSSWTRFFADIGADVVKPGMLPSAEEIIPEV